MKIFHRKKRKKNVCWLRKTLIPSRHLEYVLNICCYSTCFLHEKHNWKKHDFSSGWFEVSDFSSSAMLFIIFNQDGALFSLNGKLLKLQDQFIYLSSNISSTESVVNICVIQEWTAINRLTTIQRSDLSDKIR